MSEYPYQAQQDLIDEYLEIPAEERPPLGEWVALQVEVMATAFTALADPYMPLFQNIWLNRVMAANDEAAARRRKRGLKSSIPAW